MKLSNNRYIKLLSKYLKDSKLQLFLLAIIMGGTIAIQLVNPQIISYFIDGIIANKPTKALIFAAVIFILAAFVQQVLALASTYLSQNIGWSTTNTMRLQLVKHCIGLDMSFFKEHQSGEIVERIDGDVTALFNFFSKLLVSFVNNIILMAGIIIIMGFHNILIGLAFILYLIAAFLVIWKTQGGAIDNFGKEREMSAKFYGFLGEHIGSTEDIRANGATQYVMNRFYQLLQKWLPIRLKAHLAGYKVWITLEGIFGFGYVMIFALGGFLWYTDKISIGIVYLMINYIQLLGKPLEQLREQLLDIQKATASIVRIEELLNLKSNLKEEGNLILEDHKLTLGMNQVSFGYEENTPVLRNITFELSSGKILGVTKASYTR